MSKEEEWRPCAGFPDYYVSNLGRIMSTKFTKPRIMKLGSDPSGYPSVQLCHNNVIRVRRVHRLVAIAFYGPPQKGQEVRHLNGNKADNRLENLSWGSQSENALDRVRHGTHQWAKLTHCVRGHEFTPENIYSSPSRPRARNCRACRRERYQRRLLRAAGISSLAVAA